MSQLEQSFLSPETLGVLPHIQLLNRPPDPRPSHGGGLERFGRIVMGRMPRRLLAGLMGASVAFGVIDVAANPTPAAATAGAVMQTSQEGDIRVDIPINGGAQTCSMDYGSSTDYDTLSRELYGKLDAIIDKPLNQAAVTQNFRNTLTNINSGLQGYAAGSARCVNNQPAGTNTPSNKQQPSSQQQSSNKDPVKLPNGSTDYGDGPSKCGWRYCMGSAKLPREGNKKVPKIQEQKTPQEHPFAEGAARTTKNGIENAKATAKSVDKAARPFKGPAAAIGEAVLSCPSGWRVEGGCKGLPGNINPWAILRVVPNEAREPFVISKPSSSGSAVVTCVLMPGDFRGYTELGEILAKERARATDGPVMPDFAREVTGRLDKTLGGYDPDNFLCFIELKQYSKLN